MKSKILVLLMSTLILSACGNKGPLVMPQKPVPVETESVPAPVPAEAPAVTPEAAPEATPEATTTPPDAPSNPAPK